MHTHTLCIRHTSPELTSHYSPSLPPSLPLTHTQVAKFKRILDNAVSADRIVKEKFEAHLAAMNLLCKPLDELNAAIPKAGTHAAVISGSQVRGGEERVCVCV